VGKKISDKKIRKLTKFKANFMLVKIFIVQKIIQIHNIWNFICMSKTLPFLVLMSLKYCAEKRLLKTHVAFFFFLMKVTVFCPTRDNFRNGPSNKISVGKAKIAGNRIL
jgi:hypothetical protein